MIPCGRRDVVLDEVRPGYYWQGKVLRFAEVRAVHRAVTEPTGTLPPPTKEPSSWKRSWESTWAPPTAKWRSSATARPKYCTRTARRSSPRSSAGTPTAGLLVGAAARNQWLLAPDRTVRSIKRRMGTAETVRWATGNIRRRKSRPSSCGRSSSGREAAWRIRSARPSSPCPPSSTRRSARRPARPASWPAWRWCGSSTSRPPPR